MQKFRSKAYLVVPVNGKRIKSKLFEVGQILQFLTNFLATRTAYNAKAGKAASAAATKE